MSQQNSNKATDNSRQFTQSSISPVAIPLCKTAPDGLHWNSTQTSGALLRSRRRCRRGLLQAVNIFDHDKDRKGNGEEINAHVEEVAIGDDRCARLSGRGKSFKGLIIQANEQVIEIHAAEKHGQWAT